MSHFASTQDVGAHRPHELGSRALTFQSSQQTVQNPVQCLTTPISGHFTALYLFPLLKNENNNNNSAHFQGLL